MLGQHYDLQNVWTLGFILSILPESSVRLLHRMVEGKGILRLYLSFIFLIMQGSSHRKLSFYLYITFTFSGFHLKTQTSPISDNA